MTIRTPPSSSPSPSPPTALIALLSRTTHHLTNLTPPPSHPPTVHYIRLYLLLLRLSRWAICAVPTPATPSPSLSVAAQEASEDLLTDLLAELHRTGHPTHSPGAITGQQDRDRDSDGEWVRPSNAGGQVQAIPPPLSRIYGGIFKLVTARLASISTGQGQRQGQGWGVVDIKPTRQGGGGGGGIKIKVESLAEFDFVVGWASDTLTSLEGVLGGGGEKMRRELCRGEVDGIVAAARDKDDTCMVQYMLDAVAIEVGEHRDRLLEAELKGRL